MVEAIKCYKSRDETNNFRDLCYVVPQGSSFKQFVDGYVALQCRDLTIFIARSLDGNLTFESEKI